MAQTKNNKTAPRARLAHKLARYVRANPIHLQSGASSQNPSITHLSTLWSYFSPRWCRKQKIEKQCQHLVPSWWWIKALPKKEQPTQAIHWKKIRRTRQRCRSFVRKTQRKKSCRSQNPRIWKSFSHWTIRRQRCPIEESQPSFRHCHLNQGPIGRCHCQHRWCLVQETTIMDSISIEERFRSQIQKSWTKQISRIPMESQRQDHSKTSWCQAFGKHQEGWTLERIFGNQIYSLQQQQTPRNAILMMF